MGLNGFFGKLLKGIATAIGGAIGGVVGATIASQVFEWADNAFFNNSLTDNQGWFVPASPNPNVPSVIKRQPLTPMPFTPITPMPFPNTETSGNETSGNSNISAEEAENIRVQNLKIWLQSKITTHWINKFFGQLKNIDVQSNSYRKSVNKILLRLETLRLYYEGKSNQILGKQKGIDFESIIEEAEIKSKAELFKVLSQALRNSYEKALKNANKTIFQKNIQNFKASKYSLEGKAPENINFNFEASTSIKLYVSSQTDNITITYIDGTQDTSTSEQAEVPNTPNVNETTPTATVTNQSLKSAGLWFVGLVGAGWLWKQLTSKSKPQN